jgi:transposase-like protein
MTEGPVVGWGERGVTVRALPGWDGWVFRLAPRPDPDGQRSVVAALELIAPLGESIDIKTFKRVPIGTLLQLATDPSAAVHAHAAGLVPDAAELRARSYSPEHLDAVAAVYRYAVSQGVPPRAVLAELFDVVDKTVDRWLRRAREHGLLGTWTDERTAEVTPRTAKPRKD